MPPDVAVQCESRVLCQGYNRSFALTPARLSASPILDPLNVLADAVTQIACELLVPGRSWPKVAGWWVRAALLNLVQVGSVFLAGLAWDRWFVDANRVLAEHRPWSVEPLGVVGGAIVGYLVITFVY